MCFMIMWLEHSPNQLVLDQLFCLKYLLWKLDLGNCLELQKRPVKRNSVGVVPSIF